MWATSGNTAALPAEVWPTGNGFQSGLAHLCYDTFGTNMLAFELSLSLHLGVYIASF